MFPPGPQKEGLAGPCRAKVTKDMADVEPPSRSRPWRRGRRIPANPAVNWQARSKGQSANNRRLTASTTEFRVSAPRPAGICSPLKDVGRIPSGHERFHGHVETTAPRDDPTLGHRS